MTDFTKHDWKQWKDTLISILEETITLLDDMSRSFHNDYHQSRISRFRYLCCGYILISRDNINTLLLLLENNIKYQVHYICRNMFEMVVNITYINNDKSKREERVNRFFDYQIVQRYNLLDTLKHVPQIPQNFRNEKDDIKIEKDYNDYLTRHNIGKNRGIVTNWSGIGLHRMMEEIPDEKKRNDLLIHYYMMTRVNNYYVHPSIEYIKIMIDSEYEKGDKYGDKDEMEVTLLQSIYISVSKIIEIYLEHFQKNRPTFLDKFSELETRYQTIHSKINM